MAAKGHTDQHGLRISNRQSTRMNANQNPCNSARSDLFVETASKRKTPLPACGEREGRGESRPSQIPDLQPVKKPASITLMAAKRQSFQILGIMTRLRYAFFAVLLLSAGCERRDDHTSLRYCIANLKQMDAAKAMWAVDHKKSTNDVPTMSDLLPYLQVTLSCPRGGVYTLGRVVDPATCSIAGHRLPAAGSPK